MMLHPNPRDQKKIQRKSQQWQSLSKSRQWQSLSKSQQ
jgi:hypothetical protein